MTTLDHEKRKTGIGGSDWKDVLSIPPYGCRRKLFLEKTDSKLDYKPDYRPVMERGHKLEQLVADEYEKRTGSIVEMIDPAGVPRQDLPEWWIGNPDRYIFGDDKTREVSLTGILECKTKGQWAFLKVKKEGIPDYEILQNVHYQALAGVNWSDEMILWPDGWEFYTTRINRPDSIVEMMTKEGDEFWSQVVDGNCPDRLDPTKVKVCLSCPFRVSCQGAAMLAVIPKKDRDVELEQSTDSELIELVSRRQELKALESELKGELDSVNGLIKGRIGDPKKIQVPGFRVYYTQSSPSISIDQAQLKKSEPDLSKRLLEDYKKIRAGAKRLTVYPV